MFDFLIKKPRQAVLEPAGVTITVAAGEKLLNAALESGIAWPHDCRVGSCGSCRCVLKSGKIKPLRDFTYTLDRADLEAGVILACQSLLRSDITVELRLDDAARSGPTEQHRARIEETRALTHDILEIVCVTEQPCFTNAMAGQYAELSVPHIEHPRSYSFARAPQVQAPGEVSFFIRHVPGGEFTDWLFAADRRGCEITLSGPFGNFYLREGTGPIVCVAGGSGLAPIKAILEHGVSTGVARDAAVYFGARTSADLYCLDELNSLGEQWRGRFEVVPVLSHETDDSTWQGARGLVTATVESHWTAHHDAQAYLCGPPPMVDAAIATLSDLGLPEAHIFYDKFDDASTIVRG